jgi:hypothetical protein
MNIEGKTNRYRKRNEISLEAGDRNLLTGSEEKRLQWISHVKEMDGRILRIRELGLKFKGKRPMI